MKEKRSNAGVVRLHKVADSVRLRALLEHALFEHSYGYNPVDINKT